MTRSFQFGSSLIKYHLEFSKRKSMGITVNPNMRVMVNAPLTTPLEKIEARLKRRAPWIIKQQNFFLSFQPKTPPRKFISGETHLYLGRQYRLKVNHRKQDSVSLKGRFIEVNTDDKSKAEKLVTDWYLVNAKIKLKEYALTHVNRFKRYKVVPSAIVIRRMSTRWGSCTPKGKILLNPELIKAPKGCIEYVIIHELCHLVNANHSRKFFDLQAREMPDWEKWKMRLELIMG
jgi:predicted metal-dependent hydrolase